MAKVYGIHDIVLHPGVNEEDFVRFFHQELKRPYEGSGWNLILLKGDRGQRKGKYAVMFEIESLEMRDRYSPQPHQSSEESERWASEHKELGESLMAKWNSFTPTDLTTHLEYTDYIEAV